MTRHSWLPDSWLPALGTMIAVLMTAPVSAAPDVVASIKPVHSLVAQVMEGVGTPTLLVKGVASPHTYTLRPSDAGALERAELVFWTGAGMEGFLAGAIGALAPRAQVVELAAASGLTLLPMRQGGAFDAHEHDHGEHDHEHEGGADMHVFLDPQNAKVMVDAIAVTLRAADPENEAAYAANAERAKTALDALTEEVAAQLAPVRSRPFVVFHDALHYFEMRFGLTVAGSITVSPETMPGAARIEDIRGRLKELDAACVFAEPQFDPRIVNVLIEGTSAHAGTLDPEGSALEEGAGLYAELIRSLAADLAACLAQH